MTNEPTTARAPGDLAVALRLDQGRPRARLERRLRASIDDVWSVITDPERIGRWLAPVTIHGDAIEGTRFTIHFDEGGATNGEVLACRAPHHLAVSWEFESEEPSIVTVDLVVEADEVVLVLDHRRLPPAMAAGYAAGWEAYVDRLDAEAVGTSMPDWDERFEALFPAYRTADAVMPIEPSGHVLGQADRPVVVMERVLAATPAEVWSAWTDPERLVRWLGAADRALVGNGTVVQIAMAATELPADPSAAENPAAFTVRESVPPGADSMGRLVFTFDDAADPGGLVTVTMVAEGDDRCRMTLQHALADAPTALEHSAGFGAGWEGFVVWLEDVLAGREQHRDADEYEALLPAYQRQRDRVARNAGGTLDRTGETAIVRHQRVIAAAPDTLWSLLITSTGVARWLGEVVEGRFGDGERVVVRHDASDPTQRQTSRITVWDPPHRLAMTWEYVGEPDSAIEIALAPVDGGTELTLTHRELGADAVGYLAGWHAHLDLLAAAAEGDGVPSFDHAYGAAQAVNR